MINENINIKDGNIDCNKIAEEFLSRICEVDTKVTELVKDNETKDIIVKELVRGFKLITNDYQHLVEDIQNRVVKYHTAKGEGWHIVDFIKLIMWYGISLTSKSNSPDYWDVTNKYHGLRMSEIISMYLMAKHVGSK